MSHLRQEMK